MPFYALVFTLRSKVDLICTRALRLVIAQSVQFSKIAKKQHRFMPILLKMQKVRTTCIFSDYWERTGAGFKKACTWKGEEGIK